ncbi:MAG: glutaredoxin domain-containing protein [Bacteroidota bacterium]
MKNVILYSSPTCHYCHMAKDFFAEHNILYTEKDVASDSEARKEAIQKSRQMGVPVIDIDGEIVVGFAKLRLEKLLDITA